MNSIGTVVVQQFRMHSSFSFGSIDMILVVTVMLIGRRLLSLLQNPKAKSLKSLR